VILVNGGERVLDARKSRAENYLHNAPLFVAEQRSERVVHVAVIAVQQANHLREFGALELFRGLSGKRLELGCVFLLAWLHSGGNVLVAEVQNRERKALPLVGNDTGNRCAAQRQPSRPEV